MKNEEKANKLIADVLKYAKPEGIKTIKELREFVEDVRYSLERLRVLYDILDEYCCKLCPLALELCEEESCAIFHVMNFTTENLKYHSAQQEVK